MYKILLSDLNKLFGAIKAGGMLYLPVEDGGRSSFKEYSDGVEYSDCLNTVRSAKDFFFPQVENIAKFRRDGKNIEIIENADELSPFVIFGVRACDAKSFSLLDRVFLSEPCDPYYKNRRESCTVITAACDSPEETCFCTAFGISPEEPGGDISVYKDNGFLYWTVNTEKGAKLTEKIKNVLTECDDDIDHIKNNIKKKTDKLPFGKLNLDYWRNTDEKTIFSSDVWDKIYNGCLGCGSCTFVCPTCQCYDIRDFDTLNGVNRFRCWDSCMYSDFTKMAHGNPRKTQKERFRQRFMHKLKYFPSNNDGEFSCVGCGRCIKSCPQSLNIVKVIRSMKDE